MLFGYLFAGVAALLFGVYLVAIKEYFTDYPFPIFLATINSIALLTYLPFAVLTLDGPALPGGADPRTVGTIVAVAVLTGVAVLFFFHALVRGEASYVAPISKIVPVFVLPIEVIALGEILSGLQIAGVLVATVAIYVANYRPGELFEPIRRAATSRAAQLALASALTFGFVDVGKRFIVDADHLGVPPQTYIPIMFAITTLMVLPFAVRREMPTGFRDDLPLFLAAGLLVAVGNHLVLLAFQVIPASVGSPIVNAQAVVAVLIGGFVLHEKYLRVRLVAALLAVLGIAMITLG
ncbi:DMT family transporter [Halococcoides cellulosivorans]|uniref:EamA family transporter n=1 Tax=Halococcoides cellulosivorans TaxID=1679096 RepID=A0A2R4X2W6_9EURY|nr:EamA family transporter [Halococcoides cellulosivorans]AWB28146.1 EamA family transporter [Halococcoides cellulosivorans]